MSEHAKENAAAWYESIREMVIALDKAYEDQDDEAIEQAVSQITESALSVMVRDGWRSPGYYSDPVDTRPEEYEILLTTGGPALRIYGRFDRYNQPDLDPILQWQDWGTPWTDWWPDNQNDIPYKDTLRTFVLQFYFGD